MRDECVQMGGGMHWAHLGHAHAHPHKFTKGMDLGDMCPVYASGTYQSKHGGGERRWLVPKDDDQLEECRCAHEHLECLGERRFRLGL